MSKRSRYLQEHNIGKRGIRTCLRSDCRRDFMSWDMVRNRICPKCSPHEDDGKPTCSPLMPDAYQKPSEVPAAGPVKVNSNALLPWERITVATGDRAHRLGGGTAVYGS